MSMPWSNGRCRIGVAKVPSQTLIALACRAIAAIAARSVIFISGLDGVSIQTRRVEGRTAARTDVEIRHVDVGSLEAGLGEDLADHFAQAVIDVVRREDVVAGLQALDQRR